MQIVSTDMLWGETHFPLQQFSYLLKQHTCICYCGIFIMAHLNFYNLIKHDLLLNWWLCWTETARPAVCLWGLYGVSVRSTAEGALPCRFTHRAFRVSHLLPKANFIMHPGSLNNTTKLEMLNQNLWVFKEQTVEVSYFTWTILSGITTFWVVVQIPKDNMNRCGHRVYEQLANFPIITV